jgi:ABC-type sugar transport system ATPase subunit
VRAADVIVGLTGLVGSGFEEVACLLYGARSAGQDVSSSGPAKPTSLG